jgi:hypothetical protein
MYHSELWRLPLIQIPGVFTAQCFFIVPVTPPSFQLNTCSSCPSSYILFAFALFLVQFVSCKWADYLKAFLQCSSPPDSAVVIGFVLWQISLWSSRTVCIPFCSFFFLVSFLSFFFYQKNLKICLCGVQFRTSDLQLSTHMIWYVRNRSSSLGVNVRYR